VTHIVTTSNRADYLGGAVQVDPGYPVVFAVDLALAFRHFQLLKLKYDELLSNIACFAFNRNMRHYTWGGR